MPVLPQTVDLYAASLPALVRFLSDQAPQHGRLVHALRLGDDFSSLNDVPADPEAITGAPPSSDHSAARQRFSIFASIIPLLPNLLRLSYDISLARHRLDDTDPLLVALAESPVRELVVTSAGRRRVFEGEASRVLPQVLQSRPNLKRLTLRITVWWQPTSYARLLGALASLAQLEYLAVIGDFLIEMFDHEALQRLRWPLKELVVSRGSMRSFARLLLFIKRCESTLEKVRIGVVKDLSWGELPSTLELREWSLAKGVVLDLVEETQWDYLGGEGQELDPEEPVWEWTEDELGNVQREWDYEQEEWEGEYWGDRSWG